MKNLIVIAVLAITLFSCQKQAKDILRTESTSKKAKGNTTLETTASGLTATVSGSSIILIYNFFGQSVQYTSLQKRYTDPSGNIQMITYTWDNGTTTQSDGWVVLQGAIWSYTGLVSGYTLTDVVSGTYDFRLWVELTDGSWATSDIVTITIP